MNQPNFTGYYQGLKNRLLFRWVDIQKKHFVRRAITQSSGLKILDLGCGTGAVSSVLLPNELHGVDENKELLTIAESRGMKTALGDLGKVPYPDSTFDAVVMVDTIEHVVSREQTAKELNRILKPGGCLVAITPTYDNLLYVFLEKIANWLSNKDQSGHISPFTHESMRFYMNHYFKLEKLETLNFGMWIGAVGRKK